MEFIIKYEWSGPFKMIKRVCEFLYFYYLVARIQQHQLYPRIGAFWRLLCLSKGLILWFKLKRASPIFDLSLCKYKKALIDVKTPPKVKERNNCSLLFRFLLSFYGFLDLEGKLLQLKLIHLFLKFLNGGVLFEHIDHFTFNIFGFRVKLP